MNNPYQNIIDNFFSLGRKIPGVYDLLIRGTFGNDTKRFSYNCNWSDLDFTVIVKIISFEVHQAVKEMYNFLSDSNVKVSITLVDLNDILSVNHYHGMKPLYYSSMLKDAKSLLIKNNHYLKKSLTLNDWVRRDCYSNLVYLIHDLRDRYMKCSNATEELASFGKHLTKRTKHFVRNAIFIKSGFISEEINNSFLIKYFHKVDKNLTNTLNHIKDEWDIIQSNQSKLLTIIGYLLENIEIIYSDITSFSQEIKLKLENKA